MRKFFVVGVTAIGLGAGIADVSAQAYRPGMLGVDTNLRARQYTPPTYTPPARTPMPTYTPSRGIPPEFKPQMRPTTPLDNALRNPPPPSSPPPSMRLQDGPDHPRQKTLSTEIPVSRDTVVKPSVTGTPPDLKPNGQGGSIEGAGISIRKGPDPESPPPAK